MVEITKAFTDEDLQGILDLQLENHFSNINSEVAKDQGFVTVRHDFSTLKAICGAYKHIIAKENNRTVGYALVMLRDYGAKVKELVTMFDTLDGILYESKYIRETKYVVMGQVCVALSHRGQRVFEKIYKMYAEEMESHFDYVITEIAKRNTRSMRAHQKIGFEIIHNFIDAESGEDWNVVLLDLKKGII
jgi:hypothetical protein